MTILLAVASHEIEELCMPACESKEHSPMLITREECRMSLPYCSLHERLFLSSKNEWIHFSQEHINRVKDLAALPPSSALDFSQLKVLEGVCDRCGESACQPPFFFFILLLFTFFLGISGVIISIVHWCMDS